MEEVSQFHSMIQKITLIGIILLLIPATLNKISPSFFTFLLGVNFISRGWEAKNKANQRNFYLWFYGGLLIILISLYGLYRWYV